MKKVFGDEVIKKREKEMVDLYYSFDERRVGHMDWRSLLCLVVIVMLPLQSVEQYFKYAFILYASSGSFDLDCRDKVALRDLKRLILIPVRLTLRQEVESIVSQAWAEISTNDYEAVNAVQAIRSS